MAKTVYIFSNGTLGRRGNTLCYETEQGKRFLPIEDIQDIMVLGEVDFNKRFLEFLSQHEVVLHYFNYYGYYMGSFYPREHNNSGYMILQQAAHYLDDSKRVVLARCFVLGAVQNMKMVLKYYHKSGKPVADAIRRLEENEKLIPSIDKIPELMALEGNSKEEYYRTFDVILDNPDFVFEKRTRRPPKNNLNTLISFGNSLIYTVVLSEIYKTHLDPRIGYLHATNFRRFTLNLDVAEIFKPIIVDRLIFSLVGKKVITAKDFEKDMGGILLKDSARKRFVEELDVRLRTTISLRRMNRKVSYRRLIRLELYKLEKYLLGETSYSPYVSQW